MPGVLVEKVIFKAPKIPGSRYEFGTADKVSVDYATRMVSLPLDGMVYEYPFEDVKTIIRKAEKGK